MAPDATVCVVLAGAGYPGPPATGAPIDGLAPDGQLAEPVEGVTVIHAATRRQGPPDADGEADGPFLADGGRVLSITATAPTLAEARARAYRAAGTVTWEGCQYRRDIAERAAAPAGAAR